MMICHCAGVSGATISEAVAAGARDVDAVGRLCGAGTVCGGCRPAIGDVMVACGVSVVSVRLREAVRGTPRVRTVPVIA